MKTTVIYALCEPNTRTVRYIGMTTLGVERRLQQHCWMSIRRKNHLGNWLRSLKGVAPSIITLSEVPQEEGAEEEIRYIKSARCLGMRLVNASDGGDGGINPTPETREKISRANRGNKYCVGRVISESTREKLAEKLRGDRGYWFGKISPARGRTATPEEKRQLSQIVQGRKMSGTSSQFVGVYFYRRLGKFMARIKVARKTRYLGIFKLEVDAARAYDSAAKQYFGASAKLNFQE